MTRKTTPFRVDDPVRLKSAGAGTAARAADKSRTPVPKNDNDPKKSDLVEIASRNGEFKKNYGLFVGAFLYLRTLEVAGKSRSIFRFGWTLTALSAGVGLWWKFYK